MKGFFLQGYCLEICCLWITVCDKSPIRFQQCKLSWVAYPSISIPSAGFSRREMKKRLSWYWGGGRNPITWTFWRDSQSHNHQLTLKTSSNNTRIFMIVCSAQPSASTWYTQILILSTFLSVFFYGCYCDRPWLSPPETYKQNLQMNKRESRFKIRLNKHGEIYIFWFKRNSYRNDVGMLLTISLLLRLECLHYVCHRNSWHKNTIHASNTCVILSYKVTVSFWSNCRFVERVGNCVVGI